MDSSLTRHLETGAYKEEMVWLFKADMTDSREICIKRFVRIARKSAKFLLSPAGIAQFIVKSATQSEKIAVVKIGKITDYKGLV